MKQSSAQDSLSAYLLNLADLLDTPLPIVPLSALLTWLAPAAHRIGLTKYADPRQIAENLVAPALQLLSPSLRLHLHSPALDFGAGSGTAGLSLAIAVPDVEVVLADRRRRVVDFLDLAIRRHGLANCRSLLVDLAMPPPEWRQHCGTVLIRAFGPTTQALNTATAWLRPGGTVALWHQPPTPATPDGSRLVATEATNLPSLLLSIYQSP